jgi:outer membrane lipoprotein carrier protein
MLAPTLALLVALAAPAADPAAKPTPPPGASPETAASPTPPASAAPSAEAQALARRVQGYYERTKDLTATFKQTYTYAGFGRRQLSSGTLLVKKPGMMRWDYTSPSKKTIAVKGSRLVQLEPEENQAYVDEHFDASAMSAAVTFLLGKGDLAKEFTLAIDGAGGLLLRPKEADPRVESIALTVGPEGDVRGTRVVDGSGNVNEIKFEDVRRNTGLADATFEVKLPPGVKRVGAPGKR